MRKNLLTKRINKILGVFILTVLIFNMSLTGIFFITGQAAAGQYALSISCGEVTINGNIWTFNGNWKAVDFPGQSNQYNVALFSPSGNLIDADSKDSPDTYSVSSGSSDYTGGNQDDMEGSWSNEHIFTVVPSEVYAVFYHSQVPGNETSGDAVCQFTLPTCTDSDKDGYFAEGGNCGVADCDDASGTVFPGATEICGDDIDQDCDGSDLACPCTDNDNDMYYAEGELCGPVDCDDSNMNINPGASEICDGINNDCSDLTADGSAETWLGQSCDGADTDACLEGSYQCTAGSQACSDNTSDNIEICGNQIDEDCTGSDQSCPPAACTDSDKDGYFAEGGNCGVADCNDHDSTIHFFATEICGDDIDQDCDGSDLACPCTDNDNDMYYAEGELCGPVDCDDSNMNINPGASEICDGINNDCSDLTADGSAETWLGQSCDGADTDACLEGSYQCTAGSQACSDNTSDNIEICGNQIDEDCTGSDQSCPPAACTDSDKDGYFAEGGNCGVADCNDHDSTIHYFATEICGDEIDQDCDGSDLACSCSDSDRDGVCDDKDNCPASANAEQADADNDGIGDVCDNCPSTANADQADTNQNGTGDACEVISEENCVDGQDNDSDGSIDCDDSDCQENEACVSVCGNGKIDANETCDNGELNDACPSTCSHDCLLNECGGGEESAGDITVYKYNDLNGNGLRDYEEPFLSGWEIFLSGSQFQYEGPQPITDADGKFIFNQLPFGIYSLCEIMQDGWENTGPGSEPIDWSNTGEGPMVVCTEINLNPENGNIIYYFGNKSLVSDIIYGCTDPSALNYNQGADTDDGSCRYQSSGGSSVTRGSSGGSTALCFLLGNCSSATGFSTTTQSQPVVLGEEGKPLLSITNECKPDKANPGNKGIVCTVKVKNNGNIDALDVVLTDTVPAGFSFSNSDVKTVSRQLGEIMPGETREEKFYLDVDSDAMDGEYGNDAAAIAANHGEVKASDLIKVDQIKVLAATGFSYYELAFLLTILSIIFYYCLKLQAKEKELLIN